MDTCEVPNRGGDNANIAGSAPGGRQGHLPQRSAGMEDEQYDGGTNSGRQVEAGQALPTPWPNPVYRTSRASPSNERSNNYLGLRDEAPVGGGNHPAVQRSSKALEGGVIILFEIVRYLIFAQNIGLVACLLASFKVSNNDPLFLLLRRSSPRLNRTLHQQHGCADWKGYWFRSTSPVSFLRVVSRLV